MYAGNPINAMGNMMMMKRNAEQMLEEDDAMQIVIDTLNACITFISNEIVSHQSGMSPVIELMKDESLEDIQPKPRQFRKGEPVVPDLKSVDVPEEVIEKFFCGNNHDNKNVCTHSCNLDNPCIKDEECEGFIPF